MDLKFYQSILWLPLKQILQLLIKRLTIGACSIQAELKHRASRQGFEGHIDQFPFVSFTL